MDYLRKELHAQLRAAERLKEVKTIAAKLDTDSTFLAPSLEKYGTQSVVDLLTAVCLVEGINPEHRVMRRDWQDIAEHGTGVAAVALKRMKGFYAFALNQSEGELHTVGARRNVALTSFATWAVSNGIKLPDGFPILKVFSHSKSDRETQKDTAISRNAQRYRMCIDAGLVIPVSTFVRLPRGIGKLAKQINISTQAFSKSVRAHRETLPR